MANNQSLREGMQRFAYRVAAPRDVAINVLINGVIAWRVFGERAAIPVAGPESIFAMLVPMTIIETVATTFFGVMNGAQHRRKLLHNTSDAVAHPPWIVRAIGIALLHGTVAAAAVFALREGVRLACPTASLTPGVTITLVAMVAAVVAYAAHSRAVLQA